MRIYELLRAKPISAPDRDFDVFGVTHDSRKVRPGDLFVALEGEHCDGRTFAAEAYARGAVAVLGRGDRPHDYSGPWLSVSDPREWIGPLAGEVCGHPDRELTMVGVTGTNGKTTVVAVLQSIMTAARMPCAAIGTLGIDFAGQVTAAERTTPEAGDLFAALRGIVDRGGRAAVMEVSSHALDLGRVGGVQFDLGVFTNLSRDHLDYHTDLEAYFEAKRKLFDQLKMAGRAVVNVGDEYGRRLAGDLEHALTFGQGGVVDVERVELDERGIRGSIRTPSGMVQFESPLLGRFNLENLLAAVAAAEALGLEKPAISEGISSLRPVRGRMEPVAKGQPFPVLIDYAHTDRALAAALTSLKELSRRRVLLVFGCGGDRDRGKRRLMGRVAGELADEVIATSDNPRGEDPLEILRQVEQGLVEAGASRYSVVSDRRQAIRNAVARADESWAVLVAGKGHEEVQILGDRVIPFSDRVEIELALEERFGSGNAG